MRLFQSLHILFSFSTLVAGSVIPRDDVNPDDPRASNPKTPPKTLNRPPRPANPFRDGLKTVPSSCTDMMKPSEQCIKDLQAQPGAVNAFSGGELKWDNDNGCSDEQKGKYQTAAWDAHALAAFSDLEPNPHNSRDIALWKAWMGPDYPNQQKRISENLKRASGFLSKKSFDIILNCKDKKNYCPIRKDGKAVGGYASSYKGYFGYWYYYITACDPFFKSDDLMYKIDQIEEELSEGITEKATLARWQKNTGQMFLHEMMHLDSVGTPTITDELVDPNGVQNWAYGPAKTHQLARRNINQGGGATRASTNADSYAWLANSRFFYDLTGYFPEPDNFKVADDSLSAELLTQNQDGFFIDFGGITEKTTDEEIETRRDGIVAGFANTGSPSGPSKGKSLSIAMVSVVNSHIGGATVDSEWNFFTTGVGKAVGSCGETEGAKLISQGPSDTKITGAVNSDNPPWPAGIFKLNIEGQDCEYKCDGTNPGRLFCPNKQISCAEDKLKSKAEGTLKCGGRVSFHAAVYCDF